MSDTVPSQRLHRTLIRVEKADEEGLDVVVPAWNTRETVRITYRGVPLDIKAMMQLSKVFPIRFHAQVNIGADNASELHFSGWEIPSPPRDDLFK